MKTLIFRSAPMNRFDDVLEDLRAEHGSDAFVGVVTHSSTNPDMIDHNPLEIFNYSGKKINVFTLGMKNMFKMLRERFDKVVILGVNHIGDGYENIMFAALLTGAEKIEFLNVQNEVIEVTWREWFDRSVFWNLKLVGYSFIWLFLFIAQFFRRLFNAHRN